MKDSPATQKAIEAGNIDYTGYEYDPRTGTAVKKSREYPPRKPGARTVAKDTIIVRGQEWFRARHFQTRAPANAFWCMVRGKGYRCRTIMDGKNQEGRTIYTRPAWGSIK